MLGYSAARLTQRVPWLCVPLSREVCLFVCPTDDSGMRKPEAIGANIPQMIGKQPNCNS